MATRVDANLIGVLGCCGQASSSSPSMTRAPGPFVWINCLREEEEQNTHSSEDEDQQEDGDEDNE